MLHESISSDLITKLESISTEQALQYGKQVAGEMMNPDNKKSFLELLEEQIDQGKE